MRVFVLLISLISFLSTAVWAGTPGEVEVGGYLRDEILHGVDGRTKKLSDFRGKPLIINLWASYCGPCMAEMGSLERLSKLNNGQAFTVIGVSIDDYREPALDFISRSEVTFENFRDRQLILENMLGANSIPLTVLVDAEGKLLYKARGAYEWDHPDNIEAITKIFQLKP